MSTGRKGLFGLVGVAAVSALLASAAQASLIVDLRFSDGSKSKPGNAGTYSVDVWAQVTGTNGVSDEGLKYLYGSVQSSAVSGGVVLSGTSGVTGNTAVGPFTITNPYGQPGTAQNLTADGVADWGTVATSNTNTIKYQSMVAADGSLPAYLNTSGVTANGITQGVEFKVGTITITINAPDVNTGALDGAKTLFSWVKGTGVAPTSHSDYLDGSSTATTSAATYLASAVPANSIAFTTIPEPTAAGLLLLSGSCMMAARRRRTA